MENEHLVVTKVRTGWERVKATTFSFALGLSFGGLGAMATAVALKPEVEEMTYDFCSYVVASDVGQRVEARREGFARPTGEHEGGGLMDPQ